MRRSSCPTQSAFRSLGPNHSVVRAAVSAVRWVKRREHILEALKSGIVSEHQGTGTLPCCLTRACRHAETRSRKSAFDFVH